MSLNKRISARIKMASRILKTWQTEDEQKYPGWRFDGDTPQFKDGYGVEPDSDIPDFVKKDNDGWDYVKRSDK